MRFFFSCGFARLRHCVIVKKVQNPEPFCDNVRAILRDISYDKAKLDYAFFCVQFCEIA